MPNQPRRPDRLPSRVFYGWILAHSLHNVTARFADQRARLQAAHGNSGLQRIVWSETTRGRAWKTIIVEPSRPSVAGRLGRAISVRVSLLCFEKKAYQYVQRNARRAGICVRGAGAELAASAIHLTAESAGTSPVTLVDR